MRFKFDRQAIVLGLLAAVGPFAIDMYLPAFPAIGRTFGVDDAAVSWSLASYFVAMAVSQIFYGPLTDRLGRKKPLYFGLLLYVVAAIGCGLSTSLGMLVAFRFVQGVGGCAASVITRAVVRDLYTGPAAAKLQALIMLVFSISPLLAPTAGGLLSVWASWRWIFAAIALIGMFALGLALWSLPETLPIEKRSAGRWREVFRSYGSLLKQRQFMAATLIGGFVQAALMAYLGGSSAVYQTHFSFSEQTYSLVFAFNAIGVIGGAQLTHVLLHRMSLERLVLWGVSLMVVASSTLLGLTLGGVDHWAVLTTFIFLSFACLGVVAPATTVLALDPQGKQAGVASSLMGTLQMLAGAVAIGVLAVFKDGTARPLVMMFAGCGAIACALAWWTLRGPTLDTHVDDAELETVLADAPIEPR